MKLNQRENVVSFDKWRATRLYPGNWYKINYCTIVDDPFYKEELKRERIRVLLKRYGIIFRELLFNETIEFQWSALFQTLRIMELSGEILSGHFFEGITGIQFISASAFLKLQKGLPADALYWMNAIDPSSLCGIGIDALKATLTERIGSSHLIFHGQNLVMISKKSGAAIECKFTEDCTEGAMYCSMLKKIPFRTGAGGKPLRIETINGEQVLKSAHTRLFIEAGFLREYKYLVNSSIL
jgi:ATP-dependent Lhr-like helicase